MSTNLPIALITRARYVAIPMFDDAIRLRINQVHVVQVNGEVHAVPGADDGLWCRPCANVGAFD